MGNVHHHGFRSRFHQQIEIATVGVCAIHQVSPRGLVALDAVRNPLFGSAACSALLRTLASAPSTHLPADEYARVMARALGAGDALTTALASGPAIATVFPAGNSLVDALQAFQAAMAELGVAGRVTTFTASDFGRTLTGADGSDHGWGSTHLILGGAVNGGRFYGTAPVIANNGPDDVGQGRLLPSTSVDQYAATLGGWFGIGDADLLTVLPLIRQMPP